jgi:hypothetical protein
MVAVAAQIVHFVAKLVSTGFHLGEELAQSHHLRFQDRALSRQFVSPFSPWFHRLAQILRITAGTRPHGRRSRREPRRSSLSQAVRHRGHVLMEESIRRREFLELRYPATPSTAKPISVIAQVDDSGVALTPAGAFAAKSIETEEPSNR